MQVIPTEIPAVKIIEPDFFGDSRGHFFESYNASRYAAVAGIDRVFVQDNQSRSARGALRGLHYQFTYPQAKLVRVSVGAVFDVAVDLRRSSTTFGRWVGTILSAANRRQLWIPEGFAHGFLALDDEVDFLYKATDYYHPEDEHCLSWCDDTVDIRWPLDGQDPILSARDRGGRCLAELPTFP